jgi:hypothetical protein
LNQKKADNVRYQVLTAANIKFRFVFWDVLPCKIIDRRFRGTCCLHHQGDVGKEDKRGIKRIRDDLLVRLHEVTNSVKSLYYQLDGPWFWTFKSWTDLLPQDVGSSGRRTDS